MADTSFGPGTMLAGRFILNDLLADTDGARFWRATDETLARSVAVHVIAESDPRAASLLTAARTSALVSDGHLLRVLDAAAEDGVVYVVNEWGSGESLDQMLSEGPLSPRRAAWVVKEVAEAIATAHRNGIAHGRLLPENVMVTEAGSVKLIGFVVDAVLRARAGRDQRRVTGGDPMSAHESDVVNLAALLYAALVGRWPGTEGTAVPTAPSEHGRPLRPRQVRAGVPRALDAICERVLNAGPHSHAMPLETAHEVYAALSDYIGDPTGAPQYEPTTVLDTEGLAQAHGDLDAATQRHPVPVVGAAPTTGPDTDSDTDDLAATGAFPAPGHDPDGAEDRVSDPGQTQAGSLGLSDQDIETGWSGEPTRRTAAPPPPLPDLPERPLFADGPRRGAPASSDSPSVPWATVPGARPDAADTGGFEHSGVGTGRVPAVWGPDAEDQVDDADRTGGWDATPPGRSWLRLAAVVAGAIALVVAVLFAFNLGRGAGDKEAAGEGTGDGSPSASKSADARVQIAAVSDFDPEADPAEENPDLAPRATDGKPGTAWETLTYRGNPELGGLKSGVGLLVDLGEPADVGNVRLTLMGSPTSLQVLAAPGATRAPSSTDGLDTVASAEDLGIRAELSLGEPVTTRWLVVWLTSLPPAPGGFQGRVAEISVSS